MKCHPADWANPGRVRVLLKNEDGTPKNSKYRNSKQPSNSTPASLAACADALASPPPPTLTPAEKQLLLAISPLLTPFQPSSSTLPAIDQRFPAHSPAVSHGILESATSGKGPMGGMGGLLGGMMGGGGGGGAAEAEEEKPAEVKKTPQKPKMKSEY